MAGDGQPLRTAEFKSFVNGFAGGVHSRERDAKGVDEREWEVWSEGADSLLGPDMNLCDLCRIFM